MRYRVEAIINDDRDEGDMGLYIEGVLEGQFKGRVEDCSVYAVML
ncbi:hypothetical protein AVV38_gp42 [Mycobacterium phage Piro94]|uniref:Uncharacterized protein n=1 Tax=Mycobacterium phage Piro94 TaxID=1527520 RepID=A0A076YJE2_9CAUD|nr:hypothetical protein AVV38_gp42 [Mycobacterium phage Piro94]AIK67777.1 hypothetical protein PBI_PIRO94_61 [Mycobacterium phage Piro94]ASZ72852.1 hypothetical protein SEA_DRAKE55_63 [Mycobacterium phage Drake55]